MKDIEKIRKRIRRLLAMAGDAGSPHEAAIAARRAAAMMRKHDLSEEDTTEDSWSVDDFAGEFTNQLYKREPGWLSALHIPVAQLNGCEVRNWWKMGYGWTTQWLGTPADCAAAEATLEYLIKQISQLALVYKRGGNRTRKQMNDFRFGAACEIAKSMREIVWNQEAAHRAGNGDAGELMVVSKRQSIQVKFDVKYGGGSARRVGDGYGAGRAAGSGVGARESVRGSAPLRLRGTK